MQDRSANLRQWLSGSLSEAQLAALTEAWEASRRLWPADGEPRRQEE